MQRLLFSQFLVWYISSFLTACFNKHVLSILHFNPLLLGVLLILVFTILHHLNISFLQAFVIASIQMSLNALLGFIQIYYTCGFLPSSTRRLISRSSFSFLMVLVGFLRYVYTVAAIFGRIPV